MATHFFTFKVIQFPINASQRSAVALTSMDSSSSDTIEDQAQGEEQMAAAWEADGTLAIPDDEYEWRKYGEKFIVSIRKNRSYFKCKMNTCGAKKQVEWSPSKPSHMKVVYEGAHNHPSRADSQHEAAASSIAANQYDLATQVFGSHHSTSRRAS